MATLQQTKDKIDEQALIDKARIDADVVESKRLATEAEIEAVRLETEL